MARSPLHEAQAAEVARGRRWRIVRAWLLKWVRRLKKAAEVIGVVGAVISAIATLYGAIVKLPFLMRARDMGAVLPPPTGIASTFVDRADKPPEPK